jgi:hypothetical protein
MLIFERLNFFKIIYINSVRTSQETHYVSATKPNQLMLFRETIAVYCENHMEHINTLCAQNAGFQHVKASGIYFQCLNYLIFLKFFM